MSSLYLRTAFGVLFVTALAGGSALAQEKKSAADKPGKVPEVAAEELQLDTISVTATRNPIKAFDYPGMVTVIGGEGLATRQPSTPDDMLSDVPGVQFVGGPRRTGEIPTIRGFDGPDVIVLIDGTRQNFGSAHDGRFFIDPSIVKQAEVLRGPASSLYGSGGTGGVIEFRTKDAADLLGPGETYGIDGTLGWQTVNDEPLAVMTAYGTPRDDLDLLFNVTRSKSGVIKLGDGSVLDNTDDDILSGIAKAKWKLDSRQTLEGTFLALNNDATEPNNGQGNGNDIVSKDIRSKSFRIGYKYNDRANPWIDLDVTTYFNDNRVNETRLDSNGGGAVGDRLKREVRTIGFRADNRSRLGMGNDMSATLTYGLEGYQDIQDGDVNNNGQRDGVPDAKALFGGAYAQGEMTWGNPFDLPGDVILLAGVRFDHFKTSSDLAASNSEQSLSPRVGLSYLPNDWLMVFGNYAHAFRAPAMDELFLTGVHFQIPVGAGVVNRFVSNPNLKPQRTRTLEFGAGLNFDDLIQPNDSFQIKTSHFRIWGKDFIDLSVNQPALFVGCNPFIPGNCDGTTTSANVPNAFLSGNEVEASYENDRVIAGASFSNLSGNNTDTGANLGSLTPDEWNVHLAAKLPEIDAVFGVRSAIASTFDRVNAANERRPGYVVNNVYFTWQPRRRGYRGLRVDMGVDNIFDRAYSRVFNGSLEPGRNFKGRVSYSHKW